jgi:hypothetical protein
MEQLLIQLQEQADKYHNGHFTIFKFTTHYKISFDTVTERDDIYSLDFFPTLKEAIINCLLNDISL